MSKQGIMQTTKAPWTIDLMATLQDQPELGAIVMGPDGQAVARVMGGTAYGHRSGLVGDANARLIAASPSLYAAAKRLLDPIPGETLDAVMTALKKAVEQAEGRETS